MATIPYSEVQKHNTVESCWVILHGEVWDVTDFLKQHPGGSSIILRLAGQDATSEYDPVHPPETLEDNLPMVKRLGSVDLNTMISTRPDTAESVGSGNHVVRVDDIINLDEMEHAATRILSRKTWAYYSSAADDLISKKLNNTVYRQILLRPRVFKNVSQCSLTTTLLDNKIDSPICVCPAAMARLAHPDGEWALAEACKGRGTLQIISNHASMSPEQIVKSAGASQFFGWQLYVRPDREKSEAMLARVNKIEAIKFVCLTLDAPVTGKREDYDRTLGLGKAPNASQAMFYGVDPTLTWNETISWLKRHTDKPIVLKGLQTHEDAWAASQHPEIKAIILSNHGGRAADTAPPAIHTLLEIRRHCPEVLQRLEIIVDGGIRRGTDVVKALALGARVVGIGRAALYGLTVGGAEGVDRVLDILEAETKTAMRLLGVKSVEELGPQHVNARVVERDIYSGSSEPDHDNELIAEPKSKL